MDQARQIAQTAAKNLEGNNSPTVSARKLKSNGENSKKSTGPRTARGKANSRFNALKHGLCAKRVMFSSQGQLLDENLLKLLESLQEQYGTDDVRVQLLCDAIATEYWRQGQGLRFERRFLVESERGESEWHFTNKGCMGLLQRYLTGSQRALLKNLELLDRIQLQLPSTKQPAVRKNPEGDLAGSWRKPLKNVGVNGRTYTPGPKSSKPAKPATNNSEPSARTDITPLDVSVHQETGMESGTIPLAQEEALSHKEDTAMESVTKLPPQGEVLGDQEDKD